MTGYAELTQSLASLSRPARAVYAACCAARYVPVLTRLAPELEDTASECVGLLTDHLGKVDDRELSLATDRVTELIPGCGDPGHSHYWVMRAFSLVDYALECASTTGSDESANWACGTSLSIASDIDRRIDEYGLAPLLKRLDIEAQASSIRQLRSVVDTSTVKRLRSEASGFTAELERVLPTFLRSLSV